MKIRKDWIDTYTNEIYFEPSSVDFNQTTKKNPIIFEDLLKNIEHRAGQRNEKYGLNFYY